MSVDSEYWWCRCGRRYASTTWKCKACGALRNGTMKGLESFGIEGLKAPLDPDVQAKEIVVQRYRLTELRFATPEEKKLGVAYVGTDWGRQSTRFAWRKRRDASERRITVRAEPHGFNGPGPIPNGYVTEAEHWKMHEVDRAVFEWVTRTNRLRRLWSVNIPQVLPLLTDNRKVFNHFDHMMFVIDMKDAKDAGAIDWDTGEMP